LALVAEKAVPRTQRFYGFDGWFTTFGVISAVFYAALGLWFLYHVLLLLGIQSITAAGLTAFTLFGTSLFYYTVIEGMMSHAYSFSLFAAFHYFLIRIMRQADPDKKFYLSMAVVIALIIAVRPFNLVLIPAFGLATVVFLRIPEEYALRKTGELILWTIPVTLIILMPQLFYYKHAFGTWLVDSYSGETFNFAQPHLVEMFFSIPAGLFLYVPAFALLIWSVFYMAWIKPHKFGLFALFTLAFSYILASWHSWSYGCGFGIRPFVEWLPFFAIPFAAWIRRLSFRYSAVLFFFAVLISIYNLRMTYKWSGCWFGETETFAEYLKWFW
jgi:hypothetical protein